MVTQQLPTAPFPQACSLRESAPAPLPQTSRKLVSTLIIVTGVLIGFAMLMAQPRLASWINDESEFIGNALLFNQRHALAPVSLAGSLHIDYSPLPTWFYQAILLITHDTQAVLALHAGVLFTATIASYYWLATELHLRPGFLLILALSPGLFFLARPIWDNPFNVPASAVILASYARMLRKPSTAMAATLTAACITALMIHPMSLALIVAVAIVSIERHRRILWRYRYAIAVTAICCLLPFWRYFQLESWIQIRALHRHPSVNDPIITPATATVGQRLAFGRLALSWTGVRQIILDSASAPRYSQGAIGLVHRLAVDLSRLLYAPFVLGILMALVPSAVLKRFFPRLPLSPAQLEIARVGLITLCFQTAILAATMVSIAPFYLNGLFAVYAFFAWIGLDFLPSKIGNCIMTVIVLALFASTFLSLCYLIQYKGDQAAYGPSLGEQERLLKELHQRHVSVFLTDVQNFEAYPNALRTLALWDGLHFDRNNAAKEKPIVRYNDPVGGRLSVSDAPRNSDPSLVEIDLSVPVGWQH